MFFVGCQCQHNSRSHDHTKLCKLCKLSKLFVLGLMFVSHIGFYFYTTRQANRCVRYGSVYDHNVSLLTLSWRFSAVLQTLYQTDLRMDIRTDGRTDGADGETLIEMRGRIWKSAWSIFTTFNLFPTKLFLVNFAAFEHPLRDPSTLTTEPVKWLYLAKKKLLSGSNPSFTDKRTERSSKSIAFGGSEKLPSFKGKTRRGGGSAVATSHGLNDL